MSWQSWKIILAAPHKSLGTDALELCIYVEHEGCIMSLEFKFGIFVKTT
jgi:hypothetical protein